MTNRHLNEAIQAVRHFSEAMFPSASLVLLCGSWVRGQAHPESDLDVVIVDDTIAEVRFQGTIFESRLLDVCSLPRVRIDWLFGEHRKSRSAPIASQVIDAIVVSGDESLAREIQRKALQLKLEGPSPLSDSERRELRWELTRLLLELAHVPTPEVPALAAQCHTLLSRASLDVAGTWRGEGKALRCALMQANESLAMRLDLGLIAACNGDRDQLVVIGNEILTALGGPEHTYDERY